MQENATPKVVLPLEEWLIRAVLILLGSASIILYIGQYTDLDLILADFYFDAAKGVFPWDHTWFGRDLMHGYVKNVIVWIGYLIIATTLVDLLFPFARLNALARTRLRVVALAAVFEPLLITTLKQTSNMHCPWGVDRFGGDHPFLRLLDVVPEAWQAGHCFPAGHASTAMWFSALAVLWLPENPRRATLVFLAGIGAGFILGWVQQMRGQHFLTHTLWTAWLSSALIVALIAVFAGRLNVTATVRDGVSHGGLFRFLSFLRA
jgi:membrane-associated PAP2 superfamily phosphatase